MASLLDTLLGRREPTLDIDSASLGTLAAIAGNPIGTSTTRAPQYVGTAGPIDPVRTTVAGEPITAGQARDMARSAWQTAMSVSDGGLGAPGMMGAIRAYHGSPHSFDRFDIGKIGTGEGAQAYGHGLYFAGNEGVAKTYRDSAQMANIVSPDGVSVASFANGNFYSPYGYFHSGDQSKALAGRMLTRLLNHRGDYVKAAENAPPGGKEILKSMQEQGFRYTPPASGHMYEVNLNVEPGQLLDWDRPLAGQPEAVRGLVGSSAPDSMVGRDIYTALRYGPPSGFTAAGEAQWPGSAVLSSARGRDAPAQTLREAGIPGIQYLDAGSRTAGEGSRNYVMFDDALINILRKYAVPGAVTGGALTPLMQAGQDAQ